MNSNEYQVTIKSANQKVDDYVTKCCPEWTVHKLKQHISETHINKPSVDDQRLIYAGNLLKDSHTLKQIFFRDSLCTELTNSNKTDFTLHLVCYTHASKLSGTSSKVQVPTTSTSSTVNSAESNQSRLQASSLHQSTTSTSDSTPPQTPVIGENTPVTSFNSANTYSTEQATNSSQQAEMVRNLMQSDQMRQQLVVFQQLAQLVATQIVNHVDSINSNSRNSPPAPISQLSINQIPNFTPILNGRAVNVQITTSPINISTTASQMLYAGSRQSTQLEGARQNENNLNNENNGVDFGAQIQGAPPAPVVDQPMRAEAPIIQHDVIDWVYYSIRAAVLMAALYIHASMFRLLFIVSLLAIAYFFNRRSARRAQPIRPEPQPQEQLLGAGPQQAGPEELRRNLNQDEGRINDQLGENRNNGNNNIEAEVGAQANNEMVRGRLSFLKLCYLVVTDFLASLVPE